MVSEIIRRFLHKAASSSPLVALELHPASPGTRSVPLGVVDRACMKTFAENPRNCIPRARLLQHVEVGRSCRSINTPRLRETPIRTASGLRFMLQVSGLTTILCSFRPMIDVQAAAFRCHPCLSNCMSKASLETAVGTKMTAARPSSSYQWLHLCYYWFVALLANFILKAIRLHIGFLAWPEYPNLAPMQR